jgi:hypothetical protein
MSFWDDITIGSGNYGNTAISILDLREHGADGSISHNSVSYWISSAFLDTGLRIMKDTPEGQELKKMIDEKVSPKKIGAWLDKLIIAHLTPTKLRTKIEQAKKEAFEEGRRQQAFLIRTALNHR